MRHDYVYRDMNSLLWQELNLRSFDTHVLRGLLLRWQCLLPAACPKYVLQVLFLPALHRITFHELHDYTPDLAIYDNALTFLTHYQIEVSRESDKNSLLETKKHIVC